MSDDSRQPFYKLLFTDAGIASARRADTFVSTHDTGAAIRADAVTNCSALIVKHRKPDGSNEIMLFHLGPDDLRGAAYSKLYTLAQEPGEKTAVFVTSGQSIGNINSLDPQATAQTKHLLNLVPDVKVLPTITSGENSGMSVAYLPRSGEVLVYSYNSHNTTAHKPFSQQQGEGQSQGSGQSK